ncbi:MAG: alpha/beta fold hydrolase [Acidobacteria bacterium]|nr:alpha/beta fold hydrolase [Acidobacteriota bacterium]
MTLQVVALVGLLLLFVALGLFALVLFTAYTARRVEAALPPLGRFVEVGGSRIHYLEKGSGPTLLLIHGLGASMRTFTHSLLERLSGEFRVVVMERPGSGESTRGPGASARVRAQAETVSAFMKELGLERPLLVGHSMGGAVALTVALEHPEQVRGLALIAPLAGLQEAVPAVFNRLIITSPAVRRLVAWTVATPAAIVNRVRVLDTLFGPEAVPRDYATAGGGLLGLRPKSFCAASEDLVALQGELPPLVARYPELRMPVGIIYGKGDRVLDHRAHGVEVASKIAGAELELIEGGHMLPLTAPDVVAGFVKRVAERAWVNEGAVAPAGR